MTRITTRTRILRGREVLAEGAVANLVVLSRGYGLKWRGELVVPEDLGLPDGGETLTLEFANGAAGGALVQGKDGSPATYTFLGGTRAKMGLSQAR